MDYYLNSKYNWSDMTKTTSKRKHADFQSRYRRSSNFKSAAKNEKLVLNEKGELVLVKNNDKQ